MSIDFITRLMTIVGEKYVLTEINEQISFLEERRGLYQSKTLAVVLPADTQQTAAVVTLCAQHHVSIVPQSGNTGLCGGAVSTIEQIIISLKRLNKVREFDQDNFTLTVEAGCILADIQRISSERNLYFPLSLSAEGSCMIGGNLSTNAGGVNVLHYGNIRDLTLGLEVVLASGEIWHGLNALRKNNTGYDLKNLMIGAEGTLGIITAAVVKLFPYPANSHTAIIGFTNLDATISLLNQLRESSGDRLTTYELVAHQCLDFAFKHCDGCRDPFEQRYQWYVIAVVSDTNTQSNLRRRLESALSRALENQLIDNAVIAENQSQAKDFWRLREAIVEAQKYEGVSIKHDISAPVSKVPELLKQANSAVLKMVPGVRICAFGHLGDGNIHYNLSQPENMDGEVFRAHWRKINDVVHDIVIVLNGSFSAEHGIGQLKLADMNRYKDPIELRLMRSIKQALDPHNLMNPGKVLPLL